MIKGTSLARVPLLALCNPKLLSVEPSTKILVPLNFLTKNHFRTMYFGALAMGAELSIATPILEAMFIKKKPISFIFKDFKCDFLKRADTSVVFEFTDIEESRRTIEEALISGDRVNKAFKGKAYSVKKPENVFMTYEITLSLKKGSIFIP